MIAEQLRLEDGIYETIVKKNPVIKKKLTDPKKILAPIPGVINRVIHQSGTKINTGETILTLEAMKMECEITASISGLVKEIRVRPGEKVEKNQILAVLEEIDDDRKNG